MPTLSEIKRRINSVKNTQQITRAMKMVAAAKLRRAQEDIVRARPYADKIHTLVGSLSGMVPPESNPLFQKTVKKAEKSVKKRKKPAKKADNYFDEGEKEAAPKRKVKLLLLTSDRGLCGGFNTSLIRMADKFLAEHCDDDVTIDSIGKRGGDHFRKREGGSVKPVGNARPDYAMAKGIAAGIIADYLEDKADEIYVIYSEFQSALTQEPVVQKILPVTAPSQADEAQADSDSEGAEAAPEVVGEGGEVNECILEPSAQEVLDSLLPKYIEVQIFRSLLETSASEHGARMTSMDSASRNASDMIDNLTLVYNRVRQAAITKELMEIISGSEALK
jgi:F-type H+-transporting ATPase subunit gamma